MKIEFVDVNETRKNVRVEIPSLVVDAEIDRVARRYSQTARVPGFRPGKTPPRVIRQRFKDQILHDVAHDLVPRAVDEALRERGVEAIDTPDVRDVTIEEGQPLTFTAVFDTVPAFDPGEYSTIALTRPSSRVEEEAVTLALERLRVRAARYEPVEGRAIESGDTLVVDLARDDKGQVDTRESVSIELGSKANPPGFDEPLMGLTTGATKTFQIRYPSDYAISELANAEVTYTVTVRAIKTRVLPNLDDELAKDLGDFATLDALRSRVREDLEHEARHASEREIRAELMKQLAARVPFEVPISLVERDMDRRLEEFGRRLMEQKIDPSQAGIDWAAFRESQREVAREAVGAALALDQVARRERIEATDEEIEQEVGRFAERMGRAPAVVRAQLEKEGGFSRVRAGLRREKSIDFLMARATISGAL
ncbi:MAG: trigger factor [Acidobacteria bacterium RIFCSPLOWO2_12_FULL_65_11]|nr:MAG: trigger factor [Acidobacteria bacterium RIFCSPLOWO2_02_FULL_64_15]OFW30371.1 MAG: trigger factor [Acidobacteria bacterium RIFCSPLOWO2_12_FULL_65_11]